VIIATGCSRPPQSHSYQLAFSIHAVSPRILETSREVSVPASLTNTGLRAWDPTRIHLSYHWLWIVPREIVARSRWDLPYHAGIRTDLAGSGSSASPGRDDVASGATVTVQGRLAPPRWPGLYWLQWDMVDEGVTWFAQVAPRQPRTLVVVLPPVAWIGAPVPFLVAIWGIAAIGPKRRIVDAGRLAGVSDVIWCATALACKPLVAIHEALLEPTTAAYWLTLVTAIVPPLVALVLLPRRARAWMLVGIGVVASLIVMGDIVYYRFFGDVLSTPVLLAAGQTPRVWDSVRGLLSPALLWLVIDWPFAIWLAVRVSRATRSETRFSSRVWKAAITLAAVAAIGVAISAPRVLASTPLDQMFRDRMVAERLGVFGYHAYDAWNYVRATWLRPTVTDTALRDTLDWFETRAPLRAGPSSPYFGVARGRNLIVVQVESLQDFVVDYRVQGQEVMPHLRRWTSDSLRFTQVTDQTNEGRTSDAEFTTMTSLLPLDHGAVAFRFPGNHYAAVPGVLVEKGYTTLSAVAFESGFWNRRVVHRAYGFERSLFEPDFEMTEQIGWGLNDRDFLQQMVPRLERLSRPFAAWLITLSLHHPFEDFPNRHKTLNLGALEGTSFGTYLHAMRFFDQALEDFRSALARDGLLQTSVVVVFGDHDAGFMRDAALSELLGIRNDEVSWALSDRVPWFVRVPDSTGVELRGDREVPAGQTDFAPTVLDLLGVDAARLPYVGRNLLGAPGPGPLVRPYGDWVDARHLFLTRGSSPVCDTLDGRAAAKPDCDAGDREATRQRAVSRLVVEADLQQRLRTMMNRAGSGVR
jgi:phosphoglycerol transferase MdoB-like AlkP superfamily enzyme